MNLAVAFLIFGTTIIVLETAVIVFRGKTWGPLSTKLVGFTFIAVSAVFLALTTIPAAQLSAAYALLGVAAGYLAGRPDERP